MLLAIDAGNLQSFVKQLACGTDERLSFTIFHVAWDLADYDETRISRTSTKDGLRRAGMQGTPLTNAGRSRE